MSMEQEKFEIVKVYCNETGEDIEVSLRIVNGKVVDAFLYE